jgi:DNA polymerase III epsilon subunit-like protein
MINSLLIYDLETNGYFTGNLDPQVIEVAFLLISEEGVIAFNELINTDANGNLIVISDKITEVTGITNELLRIKGKSSLEVMGILSTVGKNSFMIVGHNSVRFDNLFVKHLTGVDFRNKTFDTGGEFKSRVMGWKKFNNDSFNKFHDKILDTPRRGLKWNLDVACEDAGITPMENRHRAITDVVMTAKLFIYQWELYKEKHTINPKILSNLETYLNK